MLKEFRDYAELEAFVNKNGVNVENIWRFKENERDPKHGNICKTIIRWVLSYRIDPFFAGKGFK